MHLILLFLLFVPAVFALLSLRKRNIGDTAKVLWSAFIIIVPIFGAMAYFIVNSADKNRNS